MAYPVNGSHRRMIEEADRLLARLGVKKPESIVPVGSSYLLLVSALHAIVDRIEKLEER